MSELESLHCVAILDFLSDDVHHILDKLRSFRVVALGPVVAGTWWKEENVNQYDG